MRISDWSSDVCSSDLATGVFGAHGGGLAEGFEGRENVITLHTFGKALGTEGALLCLPRVLADFLINRGRGFIFSTAPSPLIAAVGRAALRLACDDPRSEEHTSELQSLMRISYAVFCLKKKKHEHKNKPHKPTQ